MRNVCSGCGEEIPEGNEFCYHCGAWTKDALHIDDKGTLVLGDMCSQCGKPLNPGDAFCAYCGTKAEPSGTPIVSAVPMKRLTSMDYAALALAFIPGLFFNIFGLGQVIQKRWSKAFVYLCISGLLFYIGPSMATTTSGTLMLLVMQIGVFLISFSDVFRGITNRGT